MGGGIEDVEDQLNVLEELGSKFDADALLYKADNKTDLERTRPAFTKTRILIK